MAAFFVSAPRRGRARSYKGGTAYTLAVDSALQGVGVRLADDWPRSGHRGKGVVRLIHRGASFTAAARQIACKQGSYAFGRSCNAAMR